MEKIIIEVETDSDDSIGEIQRNVEMELNCCATPFDFDTLEVYEQADTPQTGSHITCYGTCTDKCGAYEHGDCALNARKADTPQTDCPWK